MRRHAESSVIFAATCDAEFADVVRKALADAVQIVPVFCQGRFLRFLLERGARSRTWGHTHSLEITEDDAYLR